MIRPKIIRPKVIKPNKFQKTECFKSYKPNVIQKMTRPNWAKKRV